MSERLYLHMLLSFGRCDAGKKFPLDKVNEAVAAYSELAGRGGKVLLES